MSPQIVIFGCFALCLLAAALLVIMARNQVHGALALVLAFVAAAGIWMLLEAEFLSLILILVYVGAVMTLFLFVVMMMNLDRLPDRRAFKRHLPLAAVIAGLLIGIIVLALQSAGLPLATVPQDADYSNTQAIADVLYTDYVYAFELAAVLLLVAIIAAISLAFRGTPVGNRKKQTINQQINTRRQDSVKLVKMNPKHR